MTSHQDPRIYFAAERTLLAWVRTGIALIALGFVVARLGLFLALVASAGSSSPRAGFSAVVGVALVAMGGVVTGLAGAQHALFLRALPENERPSSTVTGKLALILAATVTAVAALLAISLLV